MENSCDTIDDRCVTMEDGMKSKYPNAKVIAEGKAKILLPPGVFYNPVQEFNRDLTIAVISHFSKTFNTLKTNNNENDEVSPTEIAQAGDRETSGEARCDDSTVSDTNDDASNGDACNEDLQGLSEGQDGSLTTMGKSQKKFRILEALAASGLRSVRFALEIPDVTEIIANDYDRTAVEFIRENSRINSVEDVITAKCSDAGILMYENRKRTTRFQVIDLDPYGTPAPFLDAAVQSVADGGLLCVTCTDMAVLCGNATETCHAKYGSTSLHSKFCHEMALRILLRSIESHANRYSRYIHPLLSVSVDFYCRVFVRVHTSQRRVKESATKLSNVYQCNACGAFALQPLVDKTARPGGVPIYSVSTGPPVDPRCKHCGARHNLGGPIWSAPLHDIPFVDELLKSVDGEEGKTKYRTCARIIGVLNVVCEELQDVPLYYDMDDLCRVVHCTAVGFLPIRSAVLNAGYRVSLSHASKKSLKTDAPADVIWDIIRCWVLTHPVSDRRLVDGSTAKILLSKSPSIQADFTLHPDANPASRRKNLVRWQLNPEEDWGPKPRATRAADVVVQTGEGAGKQQGRRSTRKRKADSSLEEGDQRRFKSFVCRRLARGECDMGDDCRYSHDLLFKPPVHTQLTNPLVHTQVANPPVHTQVTQCTADAAGCRDSAVSNDSVNMSVAADSANNTKLTLDTVAEKDIDT